MSVPAMITVGKCLMLFEFLLQNPNSLEQFKMLG